MLHIDLLFCVTSEAGDLQLALQPNTTTGFLHSETNPGTVGTGRVWKVTSTLQASCGHAVERDSLQAVLSTSRLA